MSRRSLVRCLILLGLASQAHADYVVFKDGRHLKVSREVILRRLLDLGVISLASCSCRNRRSFRTTAPRSPSMSA